MLRYRFPLVSFSCLAIACSTAAVTPAESTPADTATSDPSKKTTTSTTVEAGAPPIVTTEADAAIPPAPQGCALVPDADFCDDFDQADALTAGKTKWDFIEPTDQPVATLATDRAVSAPNSLLSRIIDDTTPGAKFAKTITKKDFTQATWDYDVYLDSVGAKDGFFLDDFQFTDAAGSDTYGFRLVLFAADSGIDFVRVEHNADAVKGPYVLEEHLPDGTFALGKWMHLTQTVKFEFGDAGTEKATYTLAVDGATAFTKEYAGLSRSQAAFARIAGLALVFNKANSAGLAIHWDNQVLGLK